MYLLLFLPLVLSPAFGDSIPDYDDPYSPIFTDKTAYSWTDKITMKIIAPSWNADRHVIDSIGDDEENPIKISTRENSLEPYRFTETDVSSGIFTAEIILTGFLHDANGDGNFDTTPRTTGNGPTSGFLEVDRDSAVTISFEFADGVVLTESVPIGWNVGTIQFSKENILSDETVIVHVVDPDMNLNPESLDRLPVQIFSDSDVAGIEVDAVETSESSGLFTASVFLSQTLPSSANRLYSIPGDTIFAKYDDHTLPKPYSTSDNLEIEISTQLNSSVHPVDRLENTSVSFSDNFGNELNSPLFGNPIQIVGTITNDNSFKQKFVYIFQVKNSNDLVESISWIQSEIASEQILSVSQSWKPKINDTYYIETFIWSSFDDPTAISEPISTMILVE